MSDFSKRVGIYVRVSTGGQTTENQRCELEAIAAGSGWDIVGIVAVWFALNLAIPAFIYWQRSPWLRHRLFRATFGIFGPRTDRQLAHVLIDAAHHHR